MVIDIFGNAADTVSAHGTLRAVQIVHIHLAVCNLRRADQDQPIGTNAKMTVADKFCHCGRILNSLLKTVYIYIIVSNAVHFREFHNSSLLLFLNIILVFSVGAQDPMEKTRSFFPFVAFNSIVYWTIVIEK